MKFSQVIKEGFKGTRGVPDGSGPGKGEIGRGLGDCPKREDFKTKKEYNKAFKEYQARKLKK